MKAKFGFTTRNPQREDKCSKQRGIQLIYSRTQPWKSSTLGSGGDTESALDQRIRQFCKYVQESQSGTPE